MKNTFILSTKKKAFSMIELVFVIMILGIVSSIGASIISQVYESYIIQRAVHKASIKTELAINQLANRLTYRIDKSVLARRSNGTVPLALDSIGPGTPNLDDYRVLEWIGYENDGFSAQNTPGWSGFADLGHVNTNFNSVVTTGSDFALEQDILNSLFGGATPALTFSTDAYKDDGIMRTYEALCMYNANGCIFPVNLVGNTLQFTGGGDRTNGDMIYNEFYQLAGSAYAVVPDVAPHQVTPGGTNVWDLTLFSNYQPWLGETYVANGTPSVLLRNASVFRFTQETNSIRIKLCVIEPIGSNDEISICKEKAVIR